MNDEIAVLRAEVERLRAERDEAQLLAESAQSTLSAWFDISKKLEADGEQIVLDCIDTYLRRCRNGGMPSKQANEAQKILNEVARIYLWNALVPVVRGVASSLSETKVKTSDDNGIPT